MTVNQMPINGVVSSVDCTADGDPIAHDTPLDEMILEHLGDSTIERLAKEVAQRRAREIAMQRMAITEMKRRIEVRDKEINDYTTQRDAYRERAIESGAHADALRKQLSEMMNTRDNLEQEVSKLQRDLRAARRRSRKQS